MKLEELFNLKGKTSLVIGGSGLLGKEICEALVEHGSDLIIAGRNFSKARQIIDKLKISFPCVNIQFMEVDISDNDSIVNFSIELRKKLSNRLDILVNCGWSGNKNTFDSISIEDWNKDIQICLNGVFLTIKETVPLLKNGEHPSILNIASMYGHVAPDYRIYEGTPQANPPSYGAAKAGVIQLTKYLASFLSLYNIRVNCISPGPFPYQSTQKDFPDFIKKLSKKNTLNRIGKPFEIKGSTLLLCSRAGSFINGQNICVDGGWSIW